MQEEEAGIKVINRNGWGWGEEEEEEEEEEEGGEFFLESTVTSYQEGQRVEIKQDSVSGLWRLEYILRLLMQILRARIESGRSPL